MPDPTSLRLRFDAFNLDESNARLTRDGRPIALPPKAFAVLCTLARAGGQLISKNALLDAVWGHRHVSESVLKTVISQVRAALSDDARQPRYIETASRHGYRFIGHRAAPAPAFACAPAAGAPAIVGRTAALAKLREAWQHALAGERTLVWIAGEAGVGKTTLIESFVNELDADAATYGRCVEHFGAGEPYLPLLEALKDLCRREPELPAMTRAVAPMWLLQMPWLVNEADRAALQRELAGAHPQRMLREMRELMDRYTARRPLLFVCEDMHWSDRGTLRMMEDFARRPRSVRLMWIASFRLTQVIAEDHPLRELRQELRLHRLCEEIVLDPFSESETAAYLAGRLPAQHLSEDFVRRLHVHTGGLPLFVANVTDSLLAQVDADPAASAAWAEAGSDLPLPLPDSLAGVIEKQITRLPAEAQRVLEAASVYGMEFCAGAVATLLGQDAQWVIEHCDELVRRQYWLRHLGIVELADGDFDARYTFQHALYKHVYYQRIATTQRLQYHRQAARWLERRGVPGDAPAHGELASHYARGHETVPALRAYAEAAQQALRQFAPSEAAHLSALGLALLERCAPGEERMELELALLRAAAVAASLRHGVGSPEARAIYDRVLALCDGLPPTPERAIALNGLGWMLYLRGEIAAALTLVQRLEQIAAHYQDPVLRLFACNLGGVALVNQGRLVDGCATLERGIEHCHALGARVPLAAFVIDPEVSMRMTLTVPMMDRGFADQARVHVTRCLQRAERIGQPIARMLAHWAGGMLEVRAGNREGVARHADTLARVVDSAMLAQGQGPALWMRGWVEAHSGDPRAGHAHIMEGYAWRERLGMYASCPEALGYATEALILARDWPAAQAQLESALALAQRMGDRLYLPRLLLLKARIALGREDEAAARAALLESVDEARAQEALAVELAARVALAELAGRGADDLAALQGAYRRITEGFDTETYLRAGALLAGQV